MSAGPSRTFMVAGCCVRVLMTLPLGLLKIACLTFC